MKIAEWITADIWEEKILWKGQKYKRRSGSEDNDINEDCIYYKS